MAYCASPKWLWWWRNWWNDWQGRPKYSEKTCSGAAFSTTNPTCCLDANPGRRDGKPASNRLSYGTAMVGSLLRRQIMLIPLPPFKSGPWSWIGLGPNVDINTDRHTRKNIFSHKPRVRLEIPVCKNRSGGTTSVAHLTTLLLSRLRVYSVRW
jgi:hypothetical protein